MLSKIQSAMKVAMTNCDKYMKEEEEKMNGSIDHSQSVHLSSAQFAAMTKGSFNLPPVIGSPNYAQDLFMRMVDPESLKEPEPAPEFLAASVPFPEQDIDLPVRESRSGTRANANFVTLPTISFQNDYPQQNIPQPPISIPPPPPPAPVVASGGIPPPPPPPPLAPAPVGNAYVGRGAPPPPPMVGGLPGLPPIKVAALPVIKKVEVKKEVAPKQMSFQEALAAKFAERKQKEGSQSQPKQEPSNPPPLPPAPVIPQANTAPPTLPPLPAEVIPSPTKEEQKPALPLPPLPKTNTKENVIDNEEEEIGNSIFKKDRVSPGAAFRKEKKKGLFDDDSDDDLPARPSNKPTPFLNRVSNVPKKSLFDDDEEDDNNPLKASSKLEQQMAIASQYTAPAPSFQVNQVQDASSVIQEVRTVPKPGAYAMAARGPAKRKNSDSDEEESSNSSDSSEERRKAARLGKPVANKDSVLSKTDDLHSNIHKDWMEESMLRNNSPKHTNTDDQEHEEMIQRSAVLGIQKSPTNHEPLPRSGTSGRISQIQSRMSNKGFDPTKTMQKQDPRFFVHAKDNIERISTKNEQAEEEEKIRAQLMESSPVAQASPQADLPVAGSKNSQQGRPLPSVGKSKGDSGKAKKKSLFDDEEEDFSSSAKASASKSQIQAAPAVAKKKSSLFDDEDDEMPSSKKVSVKPPLSVSMAVPAKEEKGKKKSLFDEEDEDDFKTKGGKPSKVAAPPLPSIGAGKKAPPAAAKKKSLFDDDDEDDDFMTKPTKASANKPPAPAAAAKKKVSLFDDSD